MISIFSSHASKARSERCSCRGTSHPSPQQHGTVRLYSSHASKAPSERCSCQGTSHPPPQLRGTVRLGPGATVRSVPGLWTEGRAAFSVVEAFAKGATSVTRLRARVRASYAHTDYRWVNRRSHCRKPRPADRARVRGCSQESSRPRQVGRTYELGAASDAERRKWAEAIIQATTRSSAPAHKCMCAHACLRPCPRTHRAASTAGRQHLPHRAQRERITQPFKAQQIAPISRLVRSPPPRCVFSRRPLRVRPCLGGRARPRATAARPWSGKAPG